MRLIRGLRVLAGGVVRTLEIAPAFALFAAILVDDGPTGEPRVSSHFFPVVLWLFDDFAWTCARNSLVFALVVSLGSLAVGLGLRCALDRVWPRAQRPLGALVLSAAAIAPAFVAFGLRGWLLECAGGLAQSDSGSAAHAGASLESWSGIMLWLTWIYSSIPAGAALVAIATAPSFQRLDPAWAEAAQLVGAGRFRIARDLAWPIVRPASMRAAGLVFLLAMVEPGAPLVLGLRRTLAFQIVDSATGANPFPRTAVWSLMAGLLGLCGWVVFRSMGRGRAVEEPSRAPGDVAHTLHTRRSAPVQSMISAVFLALWAGATWLPILGLVSMMSWGHNSAQSDNGRLTSLLLDAAVPLRDPALTPILRDSALFALQAAVALLVVAWAAGIEYRSFWGRRETFGRTKGGVWRSSPNRPLGTSGQKRSRRAIPALPPLILGTGVLALPWLAGLASRFLLDRAADRAAVLAGELASAIDPRQHAWVLMSFAVGLAMLPRFFRDESSAGAAVSVNNQADSGYAAAVHAGASRWTAALLCRQGFLARLAGRFAILWVVATTNLAPALLFCVSGPGKTLGPAFLELSGGDASARSLASVLALLAVTANLAAWAVAYAVAAMPGEPDL